MSGILTRADALPQLTTATTGLLYQSESDEPFVVIGLGSGLTSPSIEDVRRLTGQEPSAPVEQSNLDDVFAVAATEAAWHGDSERGSVVRYRALWRIFSDQLLDAKAFRIGRISVHIVIAGKTSDGSWVGVKTRATET